MSNALVKAEPQSQQTEIQPFQPATIDQAWQLAEWLAEAAILPNHLRKRPSDVFATLLYGRELGLTPMQALLGVDIIEGTPGLDAQTAVALVKSSPVCKYFTCRETTSERAVFETHRAGEPTPTTLAYTIEEAKQAGLVGNTSSGKPNNYLKHPRAMLAARASMALAKLVYQDILKGCNSKEELEEFKERRSGEPMTAPPPPAPPAKAAAARAPVIDIKEQKSAPPRSPPAAKGPGPGPAVRDMPPEQVAANARELAEQRKEPVPTPEPEPDRPDLGAKERAGDSTEEPWADEPPATREIETIVAAFYEAVDVAKREGREKAMAVLNAAGAKIPALVKKGGVTEKERVAAREEFAACKQEIEALTGEAHP